MRPDGRSKAYDFDEDETAILNVEYVDAVHLIVTQTPHLVPNDEIREAPCPSCGTDFLYESSREEEPDLALWSLLAGVRVHLADPCRTCGQACPPDLSAPLPLFTFALRVSPQPKSSPLHSHGFADASLLNSRSLRQDRKEVRGTHHQTTHVTYGHLGADVRFLHHLNKAFAAEVRQERSERRG